MAYWAWIKYPSEFEFTKEPFMMVMHEERDYAIQYAAGVYIAERKLDDPNKDWGSTLSFKLLDIDSKEQPEMYRYTIETQEVLLLQEPDAEWMRNG